MALPGRSDAIFSRNPTTLIFLAKKIRKKIPKNSGFFPYKYLTILFTFHTKSSYKLISFQYISLATPNFTKFHLCKNTNVIFHRSRRVVDKCSKRSKSWQRGKKKKISVLFNLMSFYIYISCISNFFFFNRLVKAKPKMLFEKFYPKILFENFIRKMLS